MPMYLVGSVFGGFQPFLMHTASILSRHNTGRQGHVWIEVKSTNLQSSRTMTGTIDTQVGAIVEDE